MLKLQHPVDVHILSQVTKEVSGLRSLKIAGFCADNDIIETLPQLANLRALHLDFMPLEPYGNGGHLVAPCSPLATPTMEFDHLSVLSLDGDPSSYHGFLSSLSTRHLSSLTLGQSGLNSSTWPEIEESCMVASTRFGKTLKTLRVVRFGSQQPVEGIDPSGPVFRYLLPLTNISGLEELLLDFRLFRGSNKGIAESFLDGSAASVVVAFKNLRIVRIKGGNHYLWPDEGLNTPPDLPLSSILEAFSHSPSLTLLWIDAPCMICQRDTDLLPRSSLPSCYVLGSKHSAPYSIIVWSLPVRIDTNYNGWYKTIY